MSLRFEALHVEIEGSYGVDPIPTATEAIRFRERLWPKYNIRHVFPNLREDVVSNSLIHPKPGVAVGRVVDLDLMWEMKGKGSAYAASTDIEADPFLRACGLAPTVDTTGGSEKISYALAETGHGSAAYYGYAGDLRHIVLGNRANLVWEIGAGGMGMMRFSTIGFLPSDPTTVAVASSTYDSSNAPVAKGCAFTLNAGSPYVPVFRTVTLDLGNQLEVVEDGNGTDGVQAVEIVERKPTLACTIRKDAIATYNPSALKAAITSHLADLTLGQAQYNRFKLDVNEMYLMQEPKPVEYQGKAGWDLVFEVKQLAIIVD